MCVRYARRVGACPVSQSTFSVHLQEFSQDEAAACTRNGGLRAHRWDCLLAVGVWYQLRGVGHQLAERDGRVVLRYDAERFEGLDALAQAVLTAAGRRLAGTVERADDMLKRLAGRLQPSVTYNVQDGEFEVALGASEKPGAEELPIFTDVLDSIERMAEEADLPVTVIIDEFQAVVQERGVAAERQLRAVVQRHLHVGYIFAGSSTPLLADMTGDPNRSFDKLGARMFIGPFRRTSLPTFSAPASLMPPSMWPTEQCN